MISIISPILAIVILLNFILGIIILSRGLRNKINVLFGLMSLSVALWSVGILGFYQIAFPTLPSGWIIVTHTSALFISLIFLYFTLYFPESIIENKIIVMLLSLPFIIIMYYLLFTKEIIGMVVAPMYQINFGYVFYTLCILVYFFLSYVALFIQYKKTIDTIQKAQIKYIAIGSIVSYMLANIMDLILPFFGVFNFTWLGPVCTLLLVGSIAYAILRHHLFNIKVITTELLIFSVWVFLLLKLIVSQGLQDWIINGGLLLAVVVVGILLIRSVLKEVKQREQIEKLAKDVQRSLEVEKKANEELERLDKFKDQFLMTTQHNLRTPLTSLMGYSDLLLNGTFGKQNKKTKEVIIKFQGLTNGMIKMVNDFLDMAQFQLGKDIVALKPGVELGPILDEIINELKFKSDSKGILLELKKPDNLPNLNADREKLKAALFNVIDNSIKYTPKGSVTINVGHNGMLNIVVTDTGIGITKDRIENLFNSMFERGEAAKKASTVGSGIGLYLAYQIIKSHKGTIRVQSEGEGKGSTFYIELPL